MKHSMRIPRLILLLLSPCYDWIPRVNACGGLFCQPSRPVVQTGEAIAFGVEGNKVTMHVQILYEGPAEAFSWVLPVPQVPQNISVGSDVLFTTLFEETLPTFVLNIDNNLSTTCDGSQLIGPCPMQRPVDAEFFDSQSGSAKVLQTGTVGPFDFVTLQPAENSPNSVFRWLESNGYDQPDGSAPLLNYYAQQGQKFVALRLTKDSDSGEIQPLILSYEMQNMTENTPIACVPIKLTAIAANDNMPVQVYVFADSRAVPLNYLDVILDDSLVDWVGCLNNPSCYDADYRARFQAAIAPLDNHGFVTEYAGSANLLQDKIAILDVSIDSLAAAPTMFDFLTQMANAGIPDIPLVETIVETYIPLAVDEGQFCAKLYRPTQIFGVSFCFNSFEPPSPEWVFDAAGMAKELDEKVIRPAREAQAFVDSFNYMTRLYGVLGPETMDKDPFFSLKPEAPTVNHVHTATAVPVCTEGEGPTALEVTVMFGDNSGPITIPARPFCTTWQPTGDTSISGGSTSTAIQMLFWGFPNQTVRVLERSLEGVFSEEEIREVVVQADSLVVNQTVPAFTTAFTETRSSSEAYVGLGQLGFGILLSSCFALLFW